MNEIKALTFSDSPLMLEILIAGVNVIDDVEKIESNRSRLDYPDVHRYRFGQVPITLFNDDGKYSPDNDENFFTKNSQLQDGTGTPVEIKAGYETHRKTIFKGRILRVVGDSTEGTVEITCGDTLHKMHRERITDFGEPKHFRLVASDEEALNGIYSISDWVLPPSDESVTVNKDVGDPLNEVPELQTRGHLNPNNFGITDRGIETEGGEVPAAVGYPQIIMKAPYRYRNVRELIDLLLTKVGITDSTISLPDADVGNHFSSNGRVGYPFIGTSVFGTSNPISWEGFTTDFLYESGKYYFLRSPKLNDLNTDAVLVEYTETTKSYRILHKATKQTGATTQFWRLAKNGDIFAIMGTHAKAEQAKPNDLIGVPKTTPGSYDATQDDNGSFIIFYNSANDSVTERVSQTATIKAQLGNYVILGQTYGDYRTLNALTSVIPQRPPEMLPDTRKTFMFYNNELYFVCVTATAVGVAKVGLTTPLALVDTIPLDKAGNRGGVDFDIIGTNLFLTGSIKRNSESSRIIKQTDLS